MARPVRNRGFLSRAIVAEDGRPRAVVRVALYGFILAALLIVFLGLGSVVAAALGLAQLDSVVSGSAGLLFLALYLLAVLVGTWVARRFVDRRSLSGLGFVRYRGWLADIGVGLALGFALMTIVFLVELAFGWLQVSGFLWQRQTTEAVLGLLATSVVTFVIVGINEETISRGYLLQNLEEGWGTVAAVAASSVVFGLLHISNPEVAPLPIFNLVLAGVFLATAYLVTRSLWLPIALHFSWNFVQGTVYGFPVSGGAETGLIIVQVQGPALITGGAFGPEGGLLGLAVMLLGIGLLYLWGQRTRSRRGRGKVS
jgi:uncharacterized protein